MWGEGDRHTVDVMPRHQVLVAGGGPAALECALALKAHAAGLVDVELLTPDPAFVYRPLTVQDPFRADRRAPIGISEIANEVGFGVRWGRLARFDAVAHEVTADNGSRVRYDSLVIAVGARPLPAVPGALTLKGAVWRDQLTDLLMRVSLGTLASLAFVVPPGIVWPLPAYELALLTVEQLRGRNVGEPVQIAVVTSEHEPLGSFGAAGTALVSELLAANGVTLHLDAPADRLENGRLLLHDGRSLPLQEAVALPRLEGPFLGDTPHDTEGFITVTPHCEVVGLADVYAAGDATDFPIKQGDVGMQQADLIAKQIVADLRGEPVPRAFKPELEAVLLTSLGARSLALRMSPEGRHGLVSVKRAPEAKLAGRYLGAFLAAGTHAVQRVPESEGAR